MWLARSAARHYARRPQAPLNSFDRAMIKSNHAFFVLIKLAFTLAVVAAFFYIFIVLALGGFGFSG